MGSTTPNMNITAIISTNITAFGRFTYTFVLVAFNVGEFPDIRGVMTSEAYLGIFAYFDSLRNAHINEYWTSGRKIGIVIIEEHSGVSIYSKEATNATIFMSSRRIEHDKRWLYMFWTPVYFIT